MKAPAARAIALTTGVLMLVGCGGATARQSAENASYGPFSPVVVPVSTPQPTAAPAPFVEAPSMEAPTRPAVKQRASKRLVEPKPTPHGEIGTPLQGGKIRGVATWYCRPGVSRCTSGYPSGGAYAAAGPELRRALGDWRGKYVYVNGVRVKLIDWCACSGAHVVDVYHAAWLRIPHPNKVTITW